MNCFFLDPIPDPGGSAALDAAESRHAVGSRRQRPGDRVLLVDGRGRCGEATILRVNRSVTELRIDSVRRVNPPRPRIVLASAVAKGDRQRVLLDMTTQLGVAEYVPLDCERSVAKADAHKPDRWLRVCIEACKQSRNPYLPKIAAAREPVDFAAQMVRAGTPTYLAAPGSGPLGDVPDAEALVLMVGPEGGFSPAEFDRLTRAGARPVSLGPNLMRIETAAVAAVAAIRTRCG